MDRHEGMWHWYLPRRRGTHEGMEAMEITKTLTTIVALVALTLASGCQSTGSRFAWWKPGNSADQPSAVARTAAPQLPSERFAASSETPTLPAMGDEKPELPPESIASAPKADYSSVFPSSPPAYKSPASSQPATTAVAMAPQATPYQVVAPAASPTAPSTSSATGKVASLPATSLAPSASPSPAPTTDRYATTSTDRYAVVPTDRDVRPATPSTATAPPLPPQPSSVVASAGPVPNPAGDTANFDRYSRYSSPPRVPSTPATTSLPTPPVEGSSAAPVASQMATNVPQPTAGGYRPGGTSSYPATQASTVNIATRPANAESSSAYSRPTSSTDSAPSSTGSPSYR